MRFPNSEHVDIALYEVLGGSGYFEAESSFGPESVWSEPLIDVESFHEAPCALVPWGIPHIPACRHRYYGRA